MGLKYLQCRGSTVVHLPEWPPAGDSLRFRCPASPRENTGVQPPLRCVRLPPPLRWPAMLPSPAKTNWSPVGHSAGPGSLFFDGKPLLSREEPCGGGECWPDAGGVAPILGSGPTRRGRRRGRGALQVDMGCPCPRHPRPSPQKLPSWKNVGHAGLPTRARLCYRSR